MTGNCTSGGSGGPARPVGLPEDTVLVTGNPGKLSEARRLCGVRIQAVGLDLLEIQSLDLLEVLEAKAAVAQRRLARPLIVEETGLELAAMNGFPGPLVKWMLAAMGAEGMARAALALEDARATARCALLFRDGERSVLAEGRRRGRLVFPARGEHGFGWDSIFQPDGEDRTYAELDPHEKDSLSHRGDAWRRLLELLGEGSH